PHVTWLSDNDTIVFLGEGPGESPQLYKVSVSTRKIEKLTNHSTPIVAFAFSTYGDRFVYVAKAKLPAVVSEDMRRHGFAVTKQRWRDLYTNHNSEWDSRSEIFIKTPALNAPTRVGDVLDLDLEPLLMDLQISPNGRYALLQA